MKNTIVNEISVESATTPVADDLPAQESPQGESVPPIAELESVRKAGELFRDARVVKNLSIQDVSNNLRLSVKQIEALENDDFAALPEPMIVRGFMRNYARLLGVDAEPVLNAYKIHSPEKTPQSFAVQTGTKMAISTKVKQPWKTYALASALVIIGLLAWLLYVNLIGKTNQFGLNIGGLVTQSKVDIAPSVPEQLPEIALPAAERAAAAGQAAELNVGEVSNGDAIATEAIVLPSNQSTSAVVNPAVQNVTPASAALPQLHAEPSVATPIANPLMPSSAISISKFSFSAKESTWLNLVDANGKVVYSKILVAGTQDSLQIQAPLPLKVIVGNINGTTLSYNGNAVDLTAYAKLNVAKFSLK